MKAKLSIILIVALVISLTTFFMMGYAMWQIEEKGEASFNAQSYDVTKVDGVTITNTKQLNPAVFSYIGESDPEKGTLGYTIRSTEFTSLDCTLEIQNYTISQDVLENITLNMDQPLLITFNNKLIYHPLFNQTGYNLDGSNNIVFILTIYDGE